MDDHTEPEEGEARYHNGFDDDYNLNPDTDFSYIDEKIKIYLGHFQKEFEGGVSAENLGAKFGGYGSFLPTYECSPPRLSRPKKPQRNSSTPRSPNNISMEGSSRNLKAPKSATLSAITANISNPTGSIAAKYDSKFPSAQLTEKSTSKDESFNRAGIPRDQKPLKFRIKMVSDNKAHKNAAIYSGLGLDYSPSSSLGNSPEESGGTVTISQETTTESPSRILQVMTSSHVPGGALISPLHDSLLCLLKMEKGRLSKDSKSISLLKACQEHSSGLIDKSTLGNGTKTNQKKTNCIKGKSEKLEELKHANCMNVENDKTLLIKKKSGKEIARRKDLLPNDLKHTALSNSLSIAESMEATPRTSDVSVEANRNVSRGRLFSSDSAEEDSLESISGRSRTSGKKKQDMQSSSVEKGWEQSIINSYKNASLDLGDNVGRKCYQNSAPLESTEDSRKKVGQTATFRVKNKISIPSEKEKTLLEGKKKSNGSKNTEHIADLTKETLRISVGRTPEGTACPSQGFSSGKNKIHKLKLQKDINKVQDNHRDELDTNFKQKRDLVEPSMRPSQNRLKDSGSVDFKTEHNGYLYKSNEVFSGRTVDNMPSGVDSTGVVPHISDKIHASQTAAPETTAPVFIQENWVLCDLCHKWRLLPFDTRPEQLPEKWLCSMLTWLPGMNRCDISEEETTKALNALYQVPVAENQNNLQNHSNGTMSLVTSAHLQHHDQTSSSFNSQTAPILGKKKYGTKDARKAGSSGLSQLSNSEKNQQQEYLKSGSLDDLNQVLAESNLKKKSSLQQKEMHSVRGETTQEKMKNRRGSGLHAPESSKRTKIEVAHASDKHQSPNLNRLRLSLNSSTSLLTQENGRRVQDYNERSNSGDVKDDMKERSIGPLKKLVDKTQASSDGGSLDMTICDKRASVKKRKLQDRQDGQNVHELYMKEESSESGFRNEKKPLVLKFEGKQSQRTGGDSTPNRESVDHRIGGIEEVRSIDRNQLLSKHKKKGSSQITLECLDSSRRNSGTGQISMAATSSSSKVSGSRKTRANFEEVRGSPVESVSSSPMSTSYPERLLSSRGDGSGKDDAGNNGIPLSGNFRKCWNGEGTVELPQSGTEIKEKVSSDFNPRSHKSSTLDYRDRDSIRKISIKTKTSSRLGKSHIPSSDTHFVENGHHAIEHSFGEDRVNKELQGNALFSYKSDKGSIPQTKDSKKSSAGDKMKVNDPADKLEDRSSRKSMGYQSDVDPKGHACLQETVFDCKENLPKSSKDEKNYVGSGGPSGQWSSDSRVETKSNTVRCDAFDAKTTAPCSNKGNNVPEPNLIQDFCGQTRIMRVETKSGMSLSSLHCEAESQQETNSHRVVAEAQQGVAVKGSGNIDLSKSLKEPEKAGCKNGSALSSGQPMSDFRVVSGFNSHSPLKVKSSCQPATDALNDAKNLRNYADRLKSSGFVFESNEIYFQAALKFLGIATLLEASNSESSRHGEMNQIQVCSTAAKLWEICAQEYERRREMAAAALAYKCMEVAYMRIVYCKHSASSRDRNELQATLQLIPQGESPSSSTSDVDNNLHNQPAVDKAPLAKGNVSHVAGAHVVVARNRPIFLRLLDFTQDISFAMEASRKCQNAFAAAISSLEEAQNTDCIASVKMVTDFSFQDVDGLVCLVQQAMEAISRAGLGGAKD